MENEGVRQLFRLITSEQKQNQYRSQSKISECALDIGVAVPRSSFETCKFDDAWVKEKHVGILSMMVLDLQPFSFVSDLGTPTSVAGQDLKYSIKIVQIRLSITDLNLLRRNLIYFQYAGWMYAQWFNQVHVVWIGIPSLISGS